MSDNYLRACPLADLADDSATRVELEGTPVCLVRTEGEVDGLTIECWLHGSRFDLVTGHPTGLPATRPIPVYPVKIEGDDVYVSLTPEES